MSHHTPEQVAKAFAYAPKVLAELKSMGLELAYFNIFEDASGCLILSNNIRSHVTPEQYKRATELVKSNRRSRRYEVAIDFCCGLVLAAEEYENAHQD